MTSLIFKKRLHYHNICCMTSFLTTMMLLALLLLLPVGLCAELWMFTKSIVCDVDTRVQHRCSHKVSGMVLGGKYECLRQCGLDPFCIGASLDVTGHCFHHQPCPSFIDCDRDDDTKHTYWSKYCVHGLWNTRTRFCSCLLGCSGQRCDKRPSDCQRLIDVGYSRGHYQIMIDLEIDGHTIPVKVVCGIVPDLSYTQILLASNKGGIDFNRTWYEYTHGFFKDVLNFWGGLLPWHYLSQYGYKTAVPVVIFQQDSKTYQTYKGFTVEDERSNFSYKNGEWDIRDMGTPPLSFDDCWSLTQNTPFSTWDNDNDGDDVTNWAAVRGSGWWFAGGDSKCNLLGWGMGKWNATSPEQRLKINSQHFSAQEAATVVKFIVYVIKE